MNKLIGVIWWVIISQAAGLIGSWFTMPAISGWYSELIKPSFNPPNWLFGPVWFTLYTMMGVAAFLVWEKGMKKKEVRLALTLFGIQLIFNSLWSFVFFGLQNLGLALVVIVILWLLILLLIKGFWTISRKAGWLLIPYILWVSYASLLNASIFLLN